MTVMNMLIGVLCEVVSEVASKEKVDMLTLSAGEQMKDIIMSLDTDYNGMISYHEFSKIIDTPEALHTLQTVGVNPVGIVDFAELFFVEDGEPVELPFEEFMEFVLDLRESNTATVKDVMNLWMQIKRYTNSDICDIRKMVMEKRNSLEK